MIGKVATGKSELCPLLSKYIAMPHYVDGFELTFTYRTSWKAKRCLHSRTLDIVPVTLTKGRRQDASSKEVFLEVWYCSAEELKHRAADPNPFVVALAKAKDDHEFPPAVDKIVGIFRVISTGIVLSENSIETKVLERVKAKEMVGA
jgi:hypothetical protein